MGPKGDGKPVKNPHEKPNYGFVKSFLKLMFFLVDYNVGWFLKVFIRKRQSSLIIFDRYFDDLIVDPRRFRYGAGRKLAKIIRRFIPKPDLYIYLDVSENVVIGRKVEVTQEELIRQLRSYNTLSDEFGYKKVNGNLSAFEVANLVKSEIFEALSERRK